MMEKERHEFREFSQIGEKKMRTRGQREREK